MKIRDVIKMIEKDGWYRVVIEGSHRQQASNEAGARDGRGSSERRRSSEDVEKHTDASRAC
jgi:hypothetical protein